MTKQGGTTFTFVSDGIEAALEQARAAAGDKDVAVGGGPEPVRVEATRVIEWPAVTHLRYRVVK